MSQEIIASHNLRATHDVLETLAGAKGSLETILENQTDIFAIFVDGGNIIKGNKALSKIFDKPSDKLFNNSIKSLFSSESWQLFANKMEILRKHRDKSNLSFELAIDGTEILGGKESLDYLWTVSRFDAISNRRGQVFTVIGRDMTEMKRFQRRLGMIFSSVPLAIFQISRDQTISQPYSAYTEILFGHDSIDKLPLEQLFQKAYANLNTGGKFALEQLRESVGIEEFWYDIYKAQFPKELNFGSNGHDLWIGLSYNPVVREGTVEEILVVAEDITDRIVARRAKESKDATESVFTAIFSDVRNVDANLVVTTVFDLEQQLAQLRSVTKENLKDFSVILNPLHTIKGTGRTAGFVYYARIIHNIEDELLKVKEDTNSLTEFFKAFEIHSKEIFSLWDTTKNILTVAFPDLVGSKVNVEELKKDLLSLKKQLAEGMVKDGLMKVDEIIKKTDSSLSVVRRTIEIENKVRSIVMKTAKALDKEVSLSIEIDDAEVAPEILSKINEVLTHLVSNAIDHGIEDADSRSRSGKPPKANVTVFINAKDNELHFRVEDDGRGIDVTKLTAKAVSNGLFTKAQASKMTHDEKLALIFHSGLSTKEEASEVSGRGVGMDAANRASKEISPDGSGISIQSILGRGTVFKFKSITKKA